MYVWGALHDVIALNYGTCGDFFFLISFSSNLFWTEVQIVHFFFFLRRSSGHLDAVTSQNDTGGLHVFIIWRINAASSVSPRSFFISFYFIFNFKRKVSYLVTRGVNSVLGYRLWNRWRNLLFASSGPNDFLNIPFPLHFFIFGLKSFRLSRVVGWRGSCARKQPVSLHISLTIEKNLPPSYSALVVVFGRKRMTQHVFNTLMSALPSVFWLLKCVETFNSCQLVVS